jgi:hypothetical protein
VVGSGEVVGVVGVVEVTPTVVDVVVGSEETD